MCLPCSSTCRSLVLPLTILRARSNMVGFGAVCRGVSRELLSPLHVHHGLTVPWLGLVALLLLAVGGPCVACVCRWCPFDSTGGVHSCECHAPPQAWKERGARTGLEGGLQ